MNLKWRSTSVIHKIYKLKLDLWSIKSITVFLYGISITIKYWLIDHCIMIMAHVAVKSKQYIY